MDEKPDVARELARQHYDAGDPLGWFEALYKQANGKFDTIPWADRAVNPHLAAWCVRESLPRPGVRVLQADIGFERFVLGFLVLGLIGGTFGAYITKADIG